MPLTIRRLSEADLEDADAILGSAFGGPDSRLADLRLYRQIEPEGLWLALQDGEPAGMVGAVRYDAYAYVGLMAVHQAAQRQGIGLALMQNLLTTLERQGVSVILLDASRAGRPMYQKLGFMDYDESCIFRGEHIPAVGCPFQVQPLSTSDAAALGAWDRAMFGADRGRALHALLETYPGRAFILREGSGSIGGYVIAQHNRIGPWVARGAPQAEWLLQAALSLPYPGAVSVAIPGLNREAGELLRRYAFELARTNTHMGKGASQAPSQRRLIFGQTSLFFG